MRLALHTVICCCVIAAVLPAPVEDAAGDASLKKRMRAWLHNRTKTNLDGAASDAAGVQQVVQATSPPSSSGLNIRLKRAASLKASGCFLFMCTYHDLLYSLHHIYSKQKVDTAPKEKIDSHGYGRRRRRSLEDGAVTPLETDARDSAEDPPLCRYDICKAV